MTQNIGRLPIVSDTASVWSVAENPYGDDPQGAGFAASRYSPITREHTIESPLFATRAEASEWIAQMREYF